MKLDSDTISKIDQLVQTSLVAAIEKLIIEPGKIRGFDKAQTVALISTDNVPDLNGKQIGITRVSQLADRISLVKSQGDLSIEATESQSNPNDISMLELSVGKTKAQFRCASVEAVKGVPKQIADTLVWELKIDNKILSTVTQAVSAMGSDHITVASRDGKTVSLECVDGTKDVFTTDLVEPPVWIGTTSAASSFCHRFPAKTLLALLKEAKKSSNDTVTVKIGEGGIMNLNVNNFTFYVLPTN